MTETEDKPRRAYVLAVQQQGVSDEDFNGSLAELRQLAKTLGIVVVGTVTQKRASFDSAAYLGAGKRKELKALIAGKPVPVITDDADDDAVAPAAAATAPPQPASDAAPPEPTADTLLVEHEISPSQARALETELGCDVLDRTQVILEIFHHHARSPAAKAQVEMVRLQYQAPRLREAGKGKDRQRGGIGGKGTGESALELDRRKIRDRIAELTKELEALDAHMRTRRARRSAQSDAVCVALVGYTNAGKSTWMRALTGSEVYVADKLFATLDTTVRQLVPPSLPKVLVSDTVGFIRNLPHGLVASFKSTLDEALEADLLIHVVDAADPAFARQIETTDAVLAEIGAGDVPRLFVFNKIDRVPDEAAARAALLARWPEAQVLSALRPDDVPRLREVILAHFERQMVEAELRVAWDKQRVRGDIFASCQVLAERAEDDAAVFSVRATPAVLARLQSLLA